MSARLDRDTPVVKEIDFFKILGERGFEFVSPGSQEQFPETVNYTGFENLPQKEFIDGLAWMFRKYLSMFIVRDPFGNNHQARREWRHEMDKTYGKAFGPFNDRNKLRLGNIGAVRSYFETLVLLLEEAHVHTPQSEAVRNLWNTFPAIPAQEAYSKMSDDERIKLAENTDKIARSFLQLVTGQNSPETVPVDTSH